MGLYLVSPVLEMLNHSYILSFDLPLRPMILTASALMSLGLSHLILTFLFLKWIDKAF